MSCVTAPLIESDDTELLNRNRLTHRNTNMQYHHLYGASIEPFSKSAHPNTNKITSPGILIPSTNTSITTMPISKTVLKISTSAVMPSTSLGGSNACIRHRTRSRVSASSVAFAVCWVKDSGTPIAIEPDPSETVVLFLSSIAKHLEIASGSAFSVAFSNSSLHGGFPSATMLQEIKFSAMGATKHWLSTIHCTSNANAPSPVSPRLASFSPDPASSARFIKADDCAASHLEEGIAFSSQLVRDQALNNVMEKVCPVCPCPIVWHRWNNYKESHQ